MCGVCVCSVYCMSACVCGVCVRVCACECMSVGV